MEEEGLGHEELPEGAAAAGRRQLVAVDERGMPVTEKALGDVVVECVGLQKAYVLEGGERVHALKGVDLRAGAPCYPIRKGEFVMVRGPSGGGKTTLLNLLGTIDQPSGGAVRLFGRELDYHSPRADEVLAALRLERCGFVFQSFNLLGTLTAFENVELPMSLLNRLSAKERLRRTRHLLKDVGLEDRMTHLPSELSGGEQQRVTIARALANDPELLLADEPTGDLDTRTTIEIMNLLLRFNLEKKLTVRGGAQPRAKRAASHSLVRIVPPTRRAQIIMVTHNPELECYADRILYVRDGVLASQAINARQTPLRADDYSAYLHATATESTAGASGALPAPSPTH
jgi:putative ABC transport system ATP-binding protein